MGIESLLRLKSSDVSLHTVVVAHYAFHYLCCLRRFWLSAKNKQRLTTPNNNDGRGIFYGIGKLKMHSSEKNTQPSVNVRVQSFVFMSNTLVAISIL